MRMWVPVGVAILTLVGSIDVAEARARMRLSLGRTLTLQRPIIPTPAPAATQAGSSGRIGYQPALTITPGQATVAAAATAVPLAISGDATAGAGLTARIVPSAVPPVPTSPSIREVRAVTPPCEARKRVGGVERGDAGFCLIN
jgi:hypothetical protein